MQDDTRYSVSVPGRKLRASIACDNEAGDLLYSSGATRDSALATPNASKKWSEDLIDPLIAFILQRDSLLSSRLHSLHTLLSYAVGMGDSGLTCIASFNAD